MYVCQLSMNVTKQLMYFCKTDRMNLVCSLFLSICVLIRLAHGKRIKFIRVFILGHCLFKEHQHSVICDLFYVCFFCGYLIASFNVSDWFNKGFGGEGGKTHYNLISIRPSAWSVSASPPLFVHRFHPRTEAQTLPGPAGTMEDGSGPDGTLRSVSW